MKVVFFSYFSGLYGANKSLLNLIEGLKDWEVESMVLVPKMGELTDLMSDKKVSFKQMLFFMWMSKRPKYWSNILSAWKKFYSFKKTAISHRLFNFHQAGEIARSLKDFNPDIIYSNTSVINIGLLVAQKMNKPHVWHIREFGEKDYELHYSNSKKFVKSQYGASDKLIGISKAINEHYRSEFNVEAQLIYNGVLTKKHLYKLDQDRNNTKEKNIMSFGIIGVLMKNKGQEEAIRAFKIVNDFYPNTELLIAGTGKDENRLRELVDQLKLKNIKFLGYVNDPFAFYKQIDVKLVCSKNEGLGRVTLEAMAYALPVIGYDSGGTKEIITNNETGLLYKNGHTELAKLMISLIEHPEKRNYLGNNARNVFEENYTIESLASNVFEVLKSVV